MTILRIRDAITKQFKNVPSIIGPQGPEGPQGPQGPQGIQGDKGDKGDISSENFATITLNQTLTTSGLAGFTEVNYPDGFTKNNSIVVSVAHNNGVDNGPFMSGFMVNSLGKIAVILGDDKITVSLTDDHIASENTYIVKVTLMKID